MSKTARTRDLSALLKMLGDPTAAFIEAEQRVTRSPPESNQEISQLLGVNFAQLRRVNKC